jgi:S-adenosylmethionine-diacylgycerolhomoserine-N-methlytransferase
MCSRKPELMQSELARQLDRTYRVQRHVYDVTRKYYLLGRDQVIDDLAPPPGGRVLEIGSGTARNLIRAFRSYPDARLFGLDLSREMLATARRKLAAAGLDRHIRLAEADAARFDPEALFGEAQFERIFFSYSLSMIPPWQAALAHAVTHLAPGGALHIVDFGTGASLPSAANRGLRVWLAKFHVTPRDDLAAELTRLAAAHGAALSVRHLWGGYTVKAVMSRV